MWYHMSMTKADKTLSKMKENPAADWRIDQLKTIANRYGIEWRQPGTSHVTFRASDGQRLTVPAHKVIDPVYVKFFVELIENFKK